MGSLAPGKGTLKDRRRKKVFFLYTLSGPTHLINHLHNFKNSDSKDKTLETLQKKIGNLSYNMKYYNIKSYNIKY